MFDLTDVGLRLREFRPSDSDNLLALENKLSTAPWANPVPKGAAWRDQKVKELETQTEMCCVIETVYVPSPNDLDSNGTAAPTSFVGIAVLWIYAERAHRHTKYTITLAPEFQNKGYGTTITKFMVDYAFLHLNMHRISVVIPEGNDAAVAVCKKSGFVDEGRQRKAKWRNGEWTDNILMGFLEADWKRARTAEAV